MPPTRAKPAPRPAPACRRTSVLTACGLGGTTPIDTGVPPLDTGTDEWWPDEEGEGPVLGSPAGAAPPQDWASSEDWGAILGDWNVTGVLNVTGAWNDTRPWNGTRARYESGAEGGA